MATTKNIFALVRPTRNERVEFWVCEHGDVAHIIRTTAAGGTVGDAGKFVTKEEARSEWRRLRESGFTEEK